MIWTCDLLGPLIEFWRVDRDCCQGHPLGIGYPCKESLGYVRFSPKKNLFVVKH